MQEIHLVVLVHGLWGSPVHLTEVARFVREKFTREQTGKGPIVDVLVAETNSDSATYDGIDFGAERVAEEVEKRIAHLEQGAVERGGAAKVTRFSVVGYSLGGLISRYLVGILHKRKFFETVTPVNFTTFATPHIGIPRYDRVFSKLVFKVLPNLLSRTGQQLAVEDEWTASGKPILVAMADKKSVFWEALHLFESVSLYGSAWNDITVSYSTSLLEEEDPFADHANNGMTVDVHPDYTPIITGFSYAPINTPKEPAPTFGSHAYWKALSKKTLVPPALQFKFPLNIIIYMLLPILYPTFISVALVKLSIDQKGSKKRIKLLESEDKFTERLWSTLRKVEKEMEDVVADMIDDPHVDEDTRPNTPDPTLVKKKRNDGDRPLPPWPSSMGTSTSTPNVDTLAVPSTAALASQSTHSLGSDSGRPPLEPSGQPLLSEDQVTMIRNLNSLPGLKKFACHFPDVRNAHALIVCRDVKRFESHRRGEGVLRHWVDHWVV